MYWFLSFPNEPDHYLNDQNLDFDTLIRLIRGEIPSQLSQMSRIHRMMLRYSEKRANRFLRRFPRIYWAPEDDYSPLYYSVKPLSNKNPFSDTLISQWKLNPREVLTIHSSPFLFDSNYKILNPGTEFHIYSDPDAVLIESFSESVDHSADESKSAVQNDENVEKSKLLRENLKINYSWQQESSRSIGEWVRNELPTCFPPDTGMESVSNTYFEIFRKKEMIGMINIIEYKVYLTLLPGFDDLFSAFILKLSSLQDSAKKENIKFILTNQL